MLSSGDPVLTRDIFMSLTCLGDLSAEEAVSHLKSTRQVAELVVEAHDITAGPLGKVVTVDSGDEANPAIQIILVFEEGTNDVPVYGTKAGDPTSDDFDLLDAVAKGAQLRRCTPVSE